MVSYVGIADIGDVHDVIFHSGMLCVYIGEIATPYRRQD